MKKRTFTGIATAALITTAGISVTNNLKPDNPLKTGEGTVQAATYKQEFLNKAIPAATTASSKYGTYTSVMLAQATVESAWGQSRNGRYWQFISCIAPNGLRYRLVVCAAIWLWNTS